MRFKNEAQRRAVMSRLRKRGLLRRGEKVIAYGGEGRYHRFRLKSPSKFQPGSFRTIDPGKPGGHKRVIGRLRGRTTTSTQAILVPKGQMRVGGKRPLDFEDYIKNPCGCVYDRYWKRWVYRCREHSHGGKKEESKWKATNLKYEKTGPKEFKMTAGSIRFGGKIKSPTQVSREEYLDWVKKHKKELGGKRKR